MKDIDIALELTSDAQALKIYYSNREWKRIAKWLLEENDLTIELVIWILMSKHMNFAANFSSNNNPFQMSLKKFQVYLNSKWCGNGLQGIIKEAFDEAREMA